MAMIWNLPTNDFFFCVEAIPWEVSVIWKRQKQ